MNGYAIKADGTYRAVTDATPLNPGEFFIITELEMMDASIRSEAIRMIYRPLAGHVFAKNIPNWAMWSQADFQTWCDNNLMTDAQIDATTLSAALKTNLKANNAFTRNAGKMLITLRDVIMPDLPEV